MAGAEVGYLCLVVEANLEEWQLKCCGMRLLTSGGAVIMGVVSPASRITLHLPA
jgi:hypothetical protein